MFFSTATLLCSLKQVFESSRMLGSLGLNKTVLYFGCQIFLTNFIFYLLNSFIWWMDILLYKWDMLKDSKHHWKLVF